MHVLVGGVLAVTVASAAIRYLQRVYNVHYEVELRNQIRLLFFNHMQHLPTKFFNEHKVGEVTSRFKDASSALINLTNLFKTSITQGVYLLLVPPFLFYLHWKLALVAIIAIPLTVAVVTAAGRRWREAWQEASEAYSDLYAHNVETLSQIRMVKSLSVEQTMFDRAQEHMARATRTHRRSSNIGEAVSAANNGLRSLNMALFTWLGWTFILDGSLTLGSYIAFTAYVGFLYDPMKQLVDLYAKFQQSAVNLWRMFEYLDMDPEQDPTRVYGGEATPIEHRIYGKVDLRDISFGYDDELILKDVNLTIEPGESVAVVGPSGSGKTTLLRLLSGLEEPTHGEMCLDDTPVDDLPLADVRRQVMPVWQELTLFEGTIRSNLTIGLDDVTDDELDRVTKLCQVYDVIQNTEFGYDTPVAEWGASLSGGQRQRLVLARALLRSAPVYLLDEVTSNLDMETEAALLPALFGALADETVLFVTHRVESARYADRICVVEDGRVVGFGTHEQLINTCERYIGLCDAKTLSMAA
jgi:ABC-type bacteriocin/lantibiotic exporter with double-glycine peptidase domain